MSRRNADDLAEALAAAALVGASSRRGRRGRRRTTPTATQTRRHSLIGTLFVAGLAALAVLLIPKMLPGAPADPPAPPKPAAVQTARGQLTHLPVRDSTTPVPPGYAREKFARSWGDPDRNGCDTRNDILRRDLADPTFKTGSRCVVIAGTLHDPYAGRQVAFTKTDAGAVQIDHVVALADAWRSGAASWPAARRTAYYNDPRVLLAVGGDANRAKSDLPADQWQPAAAFRCTWAVRYVGIKAVYRLSVTRAESSALGSALNSCPTPVARRTPGP